MVVMKVTVLSGGHVAVVVVWLQRDGKSVITALFPSCSNRDRAAIVRQPYLSCCANKMASTQIGSLAVHDGVLFRCVTSIFSSSDFDIF